jgi:hypothetical protein
VNFAVLFPIWDTVFRTADWRGDHRLARHEPLEATGIRDQEQGVDYGQGFLSQQWVGLRNMMRALFSRNPAG